MAASDGGGGTTEGSEGTGQQPARGSLHVVATPIGNLSDVSPRVIATLAGCDLILCEDTRRTGLLLKRLGIPARRLLTAHEHDEAQRVPGVLDALRRGEAVALVTDAGTPAISDPGYRIVSAVIAEGLPVSPVPGPSAVTTALSVCGLPTDAFVFEGFPPRKRAARRAFLERLATERRTLVLLESPHRLGETLDELVDTFGGDRRAFLGRELTKLHEELVHGTLSSIAATHGTAPVRGEVVLVVKGAHDTPATPDDDTIRATVARLVADGVDEKAALRRVAKALGVPRRDVYRVVKLDGGDAAEP